MANRKKPWPELTRERIKSGMIIDRLQKHVKGEVEMSATQVSAARTLLGKTLPDLKATEVTGTVTHKRAEELSEQDLLHIAAGSSPGDSAEAVGAEEPDSVH